MKKLSIITVTYNSEKYLAECIESVIGQTYPNIEHIIIDGKSKDATVSIIQKYSNHIARWVSETDRGMYDAINKGLELASGDFVGILNSDDMLDTPGVIAAIVKAFEENNTDAVYGDLEYVYQDDPTKIWRIWKGKPYKRSLFKVGWMPAHPTFYLKKSCIDQYGGYENHYFSAADYEFMSRYLYKHGLSAYYLPMLIVKMRVGGMSNKSFLQRVRANRRDYLAMKKNNIPFAFFVSVLKPLSKLHQFYKKNTQLFLSW